VQGVLIQAIRRKIISNISIFLKRHPVLGYYVLVFVISWGGFLFAGGSGIFAGTGWQTDPRFQIAVLAMLAGPPIAGVVSTAIFSGKKGLRDLFSRLLKWRVSIRWYMVALLIAPLLQAVVLIALSLISTEYLPAIVKAGDKVTLIVLGVVVGIIGGFVEELGWTGFAIPRLRLRYSVFTTGIIVGILWGVWHLLQMIWVGRTSAEAIPLALFLIQYFFCAIAQLTAFRILMVWIYDRSESLLMLLLMHASYIFSTLFVLAPPITGRAFLTYTWVFTAVLWAVVVVILLNRGSLERETIGRTR